MGKSRQTGKLSSDGMLFPSVTGGKVGIGTTVPTETLHIQGSMRLTGSLVDYYDASGTAGQILVSTGSGVSWTSDGSTIEGVGAPGYWESNTVGLSTNSHVSIGAGLSVTGISTFKNRIQLGDTVANGLYVGNDNDLIIYETSGDVGINYQTSGGLLFIRGDNVQIDKAGSKRLKSHSGGAIDLYYDDSKKLETTNTGVRITGGLLDKDGDIGSSGQVLASTGTELNWVDAAVASQGLQGVQGVKGRGGGVVYRFSTTTTKADPGAGYFRFDDTIINQVTEIYIDHNDFQNVSQTSWIGNWSSIGGTNPIGYLHIQLFNYTWTYEVTDIVDESVNQGTNTYYTLSVSLSAGSNTSIGNNSHCSIFFVPTGLQGVQGGLSAQGVQGLQGVKGDTGNFGGATFYYTFEANTTDANPGSGDIRLNNSTQNAATAIYICDTDENGNDISSYLQTIDDSTSTIKGHVKISNKTDPSQFLLFTISSLEDNSGYFGITVSPVDSSATNPFSADEDIIITFARTGDKGEAGPQGTQGLQGMQGVQGMGFQGLQGLKGEDGADSNVAGPQGLQGSQGLQGVQGRDGSNAGQGTQGVQGLQGQKGETGAGTPGSDGSDGAQGTQGTQGLIGSQPIAKQYVVTVAGGVFVLDGDSQPSISLFRGQKYTFDQSDSSNSTHELELELLNGSGYTSGWTDNGGTLGSNLVHTFVVPYDAPDQLNYSCVAHGTGMGNTINIYDLTASDLQGLQGIIGSGAQGTQGSQGFQGLQGVGSQGTQGLQGLKGEDGADSNVAGPQGTQGTQGLQGLQGVGFQGLQGPSGAGSAITVQDEGSSLSTAASVLNFVGSGVVASGTGSTKTITISGGGGGSSTTRTVTTQTVSSATDTYSVTYDVGYLDVYLNGVRLETGEFTATNGTSVVLDNDTHIGDVIEFVAYSSVSLTSVEVSDDTTPELGGHLNLNGYNITGIGSISITGDISANNVQMATQNDAIAFAIALG